MALLYVIIYFVKGINEYTNTYISRTIGVYLKFVRKMGCLSLPFVFSARF